MRDLLKEYAARSHGKIILRRDRSRAVHAGGRRSLRRRAVAGADGNRRPVYFGLVGTNTIDGKEIIPFFSQDREPYLEYDITSLIYRLSTPKKPVLGIITSLPLDTGAGRHDGGDAGSVAAFHGLSGD